MMPIGNSKALVKYLTKAFLCLSVIGMLGCGQENINLNDPAVVYGNYCFACHDTGAAGAPLLSNRDVWQAAAQNKQRLYEITIKGVRAMPAKGTCFSCSDEQLKQVVDWMLAQ